MRHSMFILMLTIFIISCKNEDSNVVQTPITQEKSTDYYPLTIGSYWIYKQYHSDTSLVFTDLNEIDSVYVEKDSLVSGSLFKVVKSSRWGWATLYRDSSDIIITNEAEKIFTIKSDIEYLFNRYVSLTDTSFYETRKLKKTDSTLIVPSGQYKAKWVLGTIVTTVPSPEWMKNRLYYVAFAKNIGMVYRRAFYLSGPDYLEWRLLRYKIK